MAHGKNVAKDLVAIIPRDTFAYGNSAFTFRSMGGALFCFCLSEAACALAKLRALFVGEVLKCCLLGKMAVGAYLHALFELGNDFGEILKAASPVDSAGS